MKRPGRHRQRAHAELVGGLCAAAAALVPGASRADAGRVPDTFCVELRRVVKAAEFEGGFERLIRARGAPPRLGFAHGCKAGPARWFCRQSLAPDSPSLESLAARTGACLPEARGIDAGALRIIVFLVPHALVRIEESGAPDGHGGRIVTYVVERSAE